MANVLKDEKKQQVLALGRLGWSLRRIQQATGVRRETASNYLKAAGIMVQSAGRWGRQPALPGSAASAPVGDAAPPAERGMAADPSLPIPANEGPPDPAVSKPANEVTTDFGVGKPAPRASTEASPDLNPQQPALEAACAPEKARPASGPLSPTRSPSVSASEPYRELIELGLARGRNAMAIWQDLVSQAGFTSGYQSVKRFIHGLRGSQVPEAHPVIVTAPGEEAQVDYGLGPMVRDPRRASIGVCGSSC